MPKRIISPLKTWIIPELKPERTAAEIARKWRVSEAVAAAALKRGTNHEMEHTPFRYIARIIASHHVYEDLQYYPKLERWHK